MTEAAFKKHQNKQAATDNRISTHPSYKEYTWDSLTNNDHPGRAAVPGQRGGNAKNSAAAARRPMNGMPAGTAKSAKRGASAKAAPKTTVKSSSSAALKPKIKKAEKVRRKAITTIHTIAAERRYSFPLSIVLIAVSFTVLIMSIVTTSVQISEITSENSGLLRTYNKLVEDENELRLLLETRDDLRVVEKIATEELGMVKKDQVDRYYLTVHKEDRIEIIEEVKEETPGIFDAVMGFGGSVVERIRGFLGLD